MTSFGINFVYKIKKTILAKVCIQNIYRSLSKCETHFFIQTFCIHFVYKSLLKCGMHFVYKHFVYIFWTFCIQNFVKTLYSDKFWRGEKLAQLAQNDKNCQIKSTSNLIFSSVRQIKSTPNLIIFSLRQVKSIAKNCFSNKKIEICLHAVNLLNRVFSL